VWALGGTVRGHSGAVFVSTGGQRGRGTRGHCVGALGGQCVGALVGSVVGALGGSVFLECSASRMMEGARQLPPSDGVPEKWGIPYGDSVRVFPILPLSFLSQYGSVLLTRTD